MQFKNDQTISPSTAGDVIANEKDHLTSSSFFNDSMNLSMLDNALDIYPLQRWQASANLRVVKNPTRHFGFFASFLRQQQSPCQNENSLFYDSCTWALIDTVNEQYYADSLIDYRYLDMIHAQWASQNGKSTTWLQGMLSDSIKKNKIPRPDRLFKSRANYQTSPFLRISLDEESVLKITQSGSNRFYYFSHLNRTRDVSVELLFETLNGPFQYRKDGIMHTPSFYFPMMRVSGCVTISGRSERVTGEGSYSREFENLTPNKNQVATGSWSWFLLHLSDESEFSVYHATNYETNEPMKSFGIYTCKDEAQICTDVSLQVKDEWLSLVTFRTYPSRFSLSAPSLGLCFEIFPRFNAQEFTSMLASEGSFFKGSIIGEGLVGKTKVSLSGFLEYRNYHPLWEPNNLLRIASKYVHGILSRMYPLKTTDEWLKANVLGQYAFQSAVPADKICEALFHPVRTLIDRGGKSWRSVLLASCCNALSHDYFDCTPFVAMVELLHVGSLIIDDIEDNSFMRRGGNCIHIDYGLATAINAGTACYFMAPNISGVDKLSEEKANKIYKLYLELLRIGHLGQGLDIHGLDYLMPQSVASGDVNSLLDAIRTIHIYKTASITSALCSIACVLCDAEPNVSQAMNFFGLNLGLAFQIVDDARNIRASDFDCKCNEDIRNGKITYPMVKAMTRLPTADRQLLWDILRSKPSDSAVIMKLVNLIEGAGGVDLCLQEAHDMLEKGWSVLEPLLEESFSKNFMIAFSRFLLTCLL